MGKKLKKLKRKLKKAGRIAEKISVKSAEWEKRLPSGAEIVGFNAKGFKEMGSVSDILGLKELTKKKKRD